VAEASPLIRLSPTQLHTLNDVVLALYEDVTDPCALESIIDLIERLLPVSWISVDEAPQGSHHVAHLAGRRLETIPQIGEKIALFCYQNPVVAHVLNGGFEAALRISDFASFREFERTAFYHEIARFMPGWRDQAAVAVRLPESFLGFGLNRDKAFSDEERLMLELLQPHVERVLNRCMQFLRLPTEKPLTPREREVLHWLAEGKRDAEMSVILKLSIRTVEQHVGVCLRKLGVETRSAATAEVWRARNRATRLDPTSLGDQSSRGVK
jgi:DNA-binding CsgD family transcriptional regulator